MWVVIPDVWQEGGAGCGVVDDNCGIFETVDVNKSTTMVLWVEVK